MQDPVILQVYSHTLNGWPASSKSLPDKIKLFFNQRLELTVNKNCLLWRLHVVVLKTFHPDVIHLLYNGHPGMIKMKSFARLHIRWSDIKEIIEDLYVPHVHRMLQITIKYHYTSGKYLLSHGNVFMLILPHHSRI